MKNIISKIIYIPQQIFYMIAGYFEKEQISNNSDFEIYEIIHAEAYKQMLIDLEQDKLKRELKELK